MNMSILTVILHFKNRLQNHIEEKLACRAHIDWPFIIKLREQKYLCSVDTRHLFMVSSHYFGDLRTAEVMAARGKEKKEIKSILQ